MAVVVCGLRVDHCVNHYVALIITKMPTVSILWPTETQDQGQHY